MKCIMINIDKINELCIELQLPPISSPREVSFLKEYCDVYIFFLSVIFNFKIIIHILLNR